MKQKKEGRALNFLGIRKERPALIFLLKQLSKPFNIVVTVAAPRPVRPVTTIDFHHWKSGEALISQTFNYSLIGLDHVISNPQFIEPNFCGSTRRTVNRRVYDNFFHFCLHVSPIAKLFHKSLEEVEKLSIEIVPQFLVADLSPTFLAAQLIPQRS